MILEQKPAFKKVYKKLHANQKKDVDNAIKTVIDNPLCGERKVGDLNNILIYKFKMSKQLTLLAYSYKEEKITLTLIYLGTHENFYRDLKRN